MIKTSALPDWLLDLRNRGRNLYYSSAFGQAWLRFHKLALMRFPSHNVAPVSKVEERELFFKAMAPIISYTRLPEPDETANSILYLCRDKDYDISKLTVKNRNKVRRGQKRMAVRRATPREIGEKGFACYRDACARANLASITEEQFRAKWMNSSEESFREMWAAFTENGDIAALGEVWICGRWAELLSTQSANQYLRDNPNNALFYTILRDLMRREEIESVSNGSSSVQPNSKKDSLHHFKMSVNLEAIPVVRVIRVNPLLRFVFNPFTLAGTRMLESMFPNARHLLALRGAMELMMNAGSQAAFRGDEEDDGLRPLETRDAKNVAVLHREVFPDYPSTKLGENFCTELYQSYAKTEGAFGFILRRGGECVGFVAGGIPGVHEQINQTLRGRAATALLTRPALASETISDRLSKIFRKTKPSANGSAPLNGSASFDKKVDVKRAAKLVIIGVKESARGTGAAAELMRAFREEALHRGFETIFLVVRRDNERARAAYEKSGWTLIDRGKEEAVEYFTMTSPEKSDY